MFLQVNSVTNHLILIGCGGHASSVLANVQKRKWKAIVFIDYGREEALNNIFQGFPVVGSVCSPEGLNDIRENVVSGTHFVCIGDNAIRKALQTNCSTVAEPIISRHSVVFDPLSIGDGSFVGPGAVVEYGVTVGKGTIINSGSVVSHGSNVGDFCHIAVGATVCGSVNIGDNTLVGANATILPGITVSSDVVIGAGSIVTKNIDGGGRWVGNKIIG